MIVSGLLALCARTAHQGGFVGNTEKFWNPERFFSGQAMRGGFFWLLFLAVD
jgi:hypothetical protein